MFLTQVISDGLISKINDGMLKNWLEKALPGVLAFFWSVVLALLAYWIGVRLIRFTRKTVSRTMERRGVETGVMQFSDAIVQILGYVILAVVVLQLFGIESASIAAAVASVGVAAGLALQGSLSNFAGGILILVLKPFVVGDYILEDTHGNEGTVKEISIFYTKLEKYDGRIVVIPNGVLANSSMINFTSEGKRRIDMEFGISYEDDIRTAKAVIEKVIEKEPRIIEDRNNIVCVKELSDSFVVIGTYIWVLADDYFTVKWDMNEAVKYAFDEAGITIPYPQVTVSKKG